MNNSQLNIMSLLALLGILVFLAIFLGSEYLPFSRIAESLFFTTDDKVLHFIIYQIRLPRILTALLAGFGLSIAGLLMQTYFRNSLAGPSILGVTSGASLGVALLTMSSSALGLSFLSSNYSLMLASVVGSVFVLFLILLLSSRIGNGVLLLIVGVLLSSFIGAIVTILQFFTNADNIQKYILWTMGSTSSTTLSDVILLLIIVGIGFALSLRLIKPLNALFMGEEYAQSVGINITKSRFLIILTTGILAGGITAFCGPIAFVGLAVPHLVKLKSKVANHNYLLPLTGVVGAIFMVVVDTLAQVPFYEIQLPINAVTALVSAPIIVLTILKHKSIK